MERLPLLAIEMRRCVPTCSIAFNAAYKIFGATDATKFEGFILLLVFTRPSDVFDGERARQLLTVEDAELAARSPMRITPMPCHMVRRRASSINPPRPTTARDAGSGIGV